MKSIAMKLWMGMMALVAVIMVLLWLFQIVFLNNFYTRMRIDEVKNIGADIIKEIGDMKVFENKLDELAYKNNMTAELLNTEADIVYSTGNIGMTGQMPMMRNAARTKAYEKVLQGETVLLPISHPRFNIEYMLIGQPVVVSGELQGALVITLPLAPVEETVKILKKQLSYISIILLIATLLLSYLLSKSFTKPILVINNASMKMASGNLDVRIKTRRKDEIGRLAKTINDMGIELSKIDQLRKDLIANVSHELRTPLSLIKGYAETIRDISGNNIEKREKQVGIIIEEADRLTNIVEDMLNLSQMQAGYMPVRIGSFNLNEILNSVIKRYEILSERNGIQIQSTNTRDVLVAGDAAKIEQVLYNLFNNAFNHSFPGGKINVEMLETGNRIRVHITDEGEGIRPEDIPYIWERFHKADKTGRMKTAGTGLGLAIVKNILNAHQSQFGVESQLGKGSVFWFELKKV